MSLENTTPSDRCAVVGIIDPDAYTAAATSSGWIAAKNFERFMAVVMAGTLGTLATIDAKLEQAKNASGTGVKDIADKAITQLVKASNDDDQAVINLNAEELDIANGFTHFRLTMTVGEATSDAGGLVLGFDPRYAPATDNDLASVVEVVA